MAIRKATSDDLNRLVEMGALMHAESPTFRGMAFDPWKLHAAIARILDSETGFAMVYEAGGRIVGAMVGMIFQHWFSPDLMASDMALFVEPEHRGGMGAVRLLNAYADWAEDNGAAPGMTWFGITTGVEPEMTEKLCERLGWRRVGVVMGC